MTEVEFLWWQECPSWERALSMLRDEMNRAGLDPDRVKLSEIRTEAEASEHGFPGSPTIRVDGRDIQPAAAGEPGGLTCRIYRQRDSRVGPLPDPADLRDALRASVQPGAGAR